MDAERNHKFPSGGQALLLILALFVLEVIVGSALHDAQGLLALSWSQSAAMTTVLANGCLFVLVMEFKGLTYRSLFHPQNPGGVPGTAAMSVLPAMLLAPALVLSMSAVLSVLAEMLPMSAAQAALFEHLAANDLASTLLTCAVAPILEEMLFRGIILRSFLQQYKRGLSIWGSAILFGVAHLNIYQFCGALVMGLVLGWLYERTRSLIPCIALHASYNTVWIALERSQAEASGSSVATASPAVWVGSLLLALASLAFLVIRLRRSSS